MISNILYTWNSKETLSNNTLVNHGNSENDLKDKIAVWNDDEISEINILYLNGTFGFQ